MEKSRPICVTIVAILMVITGIILLSSGIFAVSSSAILSQFGGPLVAVVIGVGVFTIALGLAHFVLAWGLFKGKGWAWIITVARRLTEVLGVTSYAKLVVFE